MNQSQIARYLERIAYSGAREPNAATLRGLHVAHLYSVPFENLDIPRGPKIILDPALLFEKIVTRQRGGFCYEVNGMFSELLKALGFEVTRISARVARADGTFGAEYDHLALVVKCPSDSAPATPWFADVGFGDSFLEPLRRDVETAQAQNLRAYRIESSNEYKMLWQKNYDASWEKRYRFTLQPRAFSEFADMCEYHQTSPDSPFTRKRIISRATPRGRVSLEETRLIVTTDGERSEQAVEGAEMYQALLSEHFGVVL